MVDHATIVAAHVISRFRYSFAVLIFVPFYAVRGLRAAPFQYLMFTTMRAWHVIATLIALLICLFNAAGPFDRRR
ncbi:hypothetical protein D3C78_889500 [compost metagenome]